MSPQPQPDPGCLNIRDWYLDRALSDLRTTPAAELSAIHTVHIELTEPNLIRWHGSVWPGMDLAFDDEDMAGYARIYPVPKPLTANKPPREAFRAILRFIAEKFDLGQLNLEVDASCAAWGLFEDKAAAGYSTRDEVDQDWRFMYDFYIDVGRVVAEVFRGVELRGLSAKTSIWNGMCPWLTGQITGRDMGVIEDLPRFHDTGMPLLPGKGGDGDGVKAE